MITLKYLARYLRPATRETTPAAVKSTSKQAVSFLGQLLHTNAQTSGHKYTHTHTYTHGHTATHTHRETRPGMDHSYTRLYSLQYSRWFIQCCILLKYQHRYFLTDSDIWQYEFVHVVFFVAIKSIFSCRCTHPYCILPPLPNVLSVINLAKALEQLYYYTLLVARCCFLLLLYNSNGFCGYFKDNYYSLISTIISLSCLLACLFFRYMYVMYMDTISTWPSFTKSSQAGTLACAGSASASDWDWDWAQKGFTG